MHHLRPTLRRFWPLVLGALALLLTACPGISGGSTGKPQITSFTATPNSVAAGAQVTLSWVVTGSLTSLTIDNNVGSVTGSSQTVNPITSTTYTLTATNSSGSDTATVPVTVGGTVPPPTGGSASLTFGVSTTQAGPFQNDAGSNITSASDPRVVSVAAGNTFYAQVNYSGPTPVTAVTIYLANRNPAGFQADLVQGSAVNGFTLGAELTGCALNGTQTSVTCVYPIKVAAGTPNITGLTGSGTEFAYVLRSRVTDTAGTVTAQAVRGYVVVGSGGGGTPTPTPTPTPVTYQLKVTQPGNGSGNVKASPSGTSCGTACTVYDAGTVVTLTAVPGSNSSFTGWGGACAGAGTSLTCKVTMNSVKNVVATFGKAQATYRLTVSQPGAGKGNVQASPSGTSCGVACTIYPANTNVTLIAKPTAPASFSSWGGACSAAGKAPTCQLTMDGDKAVVATFASTIP